MTSRKLSQRLQLRLWTALVLLGSTAASVAEVKLSSVFSDHMVLQRDQPVHVWGWADADERGTVSFRGHSASFQADALGRWEVYLPPGAAGGPFTLAIEAAKQLDLHDVLVGDVWLASGQSNMQFAMNDRLANGAAEIAKASDPEIRLLTVQDSFADHPLEDAKTGGWNACTPETVKTFSAVAYFFSRELRRTQRVPIGVIEASWGGTPAEAWTSMDALTSDASLRPVFVARAAMMDELTTTRRQQQAEKTSNLDRKAAGQTPLEVPWRPNADTWAPAALFNAMIAPLTPFPVRGVIWYQGESNTDPARATVYGRLFPAMITDWRSRWAEPEMPFLFVQLANYNNEDDWPQVREAQLHTLDLRNTGMAITMDLGEADNIHPADKQDVGYRLALWARRMVYGEPIEDSGPLFVRAWPEAGEMVAAFTHAEGLTAKGPGLEGFEVAATDRHFVPATVRVEGAEIRASSKSVSHPRFLRYNWAANPKGTLANAAGLPASPFTSEQYMQ